jgi:hypothetical protein
VKQCILVFLTICACIVACDQKNTVGWQTIDAKSFRITTPQGWKLHNEQGIDAHIGNIANGRDTLYFCVGNGCPMVGDEDPEKHKLAIDTVNGLLANIVIPNDHNDGEIAMSIADVDGFRRFIISGSDVHSIDTILLMFKSVVFEKSDTSINPPLTTSKFKYNSQGSGKRLYSYHCAPCHSMHKLLVGPMMVDIERRRSIDCIYDFLADRESLKSDTAFINLMAKSTYHCPEFKNLTREQVRLIFDYVN